MNVPVLTQLPFRTDPSTWTATVLEFASGAPPGARCVLLLVPTPGYMSVHMTDAAKTPFVTLMLPLVGETELENQIELASAIDIGRHNNLVASAYIRPDVAGLLVGIERAGPRGREAETHIRTLPDGAWDTTTGIEPSGFLPRFAKTTG